eukprot:CAMPEP_0170198566 /NCGR_PEP_ID=MMETSP0040_2-20121228/68849_1 /TAXON_ID=641309 /ORGANISM="Lotharella oceanica, Strain CCMP622" /LENGTH=319 /DNA_ID=CAMNT_0010448577 /DNA_START=441 /DNA_END=1400 /DNA_ORIENTATION=-
MRGRDVISLKRKEPPSSTSLQDHLRKLQASFASLPAKAGWKRAKTQSSQTTAIVGTSTTLEKRYLRTTDAVDPSKVRNRATCVKAFAYLKGKWAADQDYKYIGEQFKSLRQDIRVQSIRDSLAIDVYEANARICLEVGDFSEFNQCQSCLRELYITNPHSANKFEFWSYRILYATALEDTKTVLQEQVEYANIRTKDAMVRLALDIAYAYRAENYVRFFALLRQCTDCGKLILHKTKWALRFKAITRMLKAYSPAKFPIQKLIKVLNFSSEKAARLWLKHIRVICKDGYILCKESQKSIRSPRFKLRREGQNGVTHNVL